MILICFFVMTYEFHKYIAFGMILIELIQVFDLAGRKKSYKNIRKALTIKNFHLGWDFWKWLISNIFENLFSVQCF